jgi:hypothetical protein
MKISFSAREIRLGDICGDSDSVDKRIEIGRQSGEAILSSGF